MFFLKGSKCLEEVELDNKISNWLDALGTGIKAIQDIGNAELGDRTMIDFLVPFYEEFKKRVNDGKDLTSLLEGLEVRADEINEGNLLSLR